MNINHPFQPIYDEYSEILILGSFPSVKSRENSFFYGNPKNRFWKVLAAVCKENIPATITEKKELLLKNHIALWDVIKSCDIENSSDSSIKNVVPNNLSDIIAESKIRKIILNGKAAEKYYKLYNEAKIHIKAVYLPSTSPANAAWTLDKLIEIWNFHINES